MRGLELRNGSVDLVVNDLAPDLVHGLESARRRDRRHRAWHRLRVHRLQPARSRSWPTGACATRSATPWTPTRSSSTCAAASRVRRSASCRRCRGRADPGVFRFTRDVARARTLLDEAGFPDPDGAGREPRLRLTLKTSTAEAYRLQAAVIQQQLADAGIALEVRSFEFATLHAGRRPRQRAALHAAVRRRHRSRHAPPRVPLLADAAGRLQSRPLRAIPRSIA